MPTAADPRVSPPARRHGWRRPVVLMIVSTMLALLAAEVACRIHGSFKGQDGPSRFIEHDDQLGWRNRPGFVGRHVSRDFAVDVCIDADGCRVPPGGKTSGASIWAVGDSNTFGWGVQAESSWVELLAKRIDRPIRNLGVSGYGPGQQLMRMRRGWAKGDRPQLVIVLHSPNDLVEAGQSRMYRSFKPQCVLVDGEIALRGTPVPFDLAKHSFLWRTITKRLGREPRVAGATGPQAETRRAVVAAVYRRMVSECRDHGARMVLVGLESGWLEPVARGMGVPFVELRRAIQRVGANFRFAHDPHWLPSVHPEIAAELAPTVARILGQ